MEQKYNVKVTAIKLKIAGLGETIYFLVISLIIKNTPNQRLDFEKESKFRIFTFVVFE